MGIGDEIAVIEDVAAADDVVAVHELAGGAKIDRSFARLRARRASGVLTRDRASMT